VLRVACCVMRVTGFGMWGSGYALRVSGPNFLKSTGFLKSEIRNPKSEIRNRKNPQSTIEGPATRNFLSSLDGLEDYLIPIDLRVYPVAVKNIAFKNVHGQRVFDIVLDHTFQRSGAVNRVVSFFGNKRQGLIR